MTKAQREYKKKAKEIESLIFKIGIGLKAHEAEFNSAEGHYGKHWGFVGDLEHHKEYLQDIHDALFQEGEYAN